MSQFIHSDLGSRSRGDVVEITLSGSAANVMLMDTSNFNSYKSGRTFRYTGGLARQSPVRLQVPSSGRWHAIVDMRGLRGTVRAGFRVINASALQPLPPIRARRPALREIADNFEDEAPQSSETSKEYDVFISHASEDKEGVVRPLATQLREQRLAVWYDEFELRIGDSLRRKIDAGIAQARFGIVVLSKPFFAKGWPAYELDGLVTMSLSGRQVLLPLWHEISKDEVVSASPSLADKVALRTADYTIEEIASEIASVVRDHRR